MTVINDPSETRAEMVERLIEDIVGPRQENEALVSRPSDVYLTGLLWPMRSETPEEEDDKLEVSSTGKGTDASDGSPEAVPAKSVMRPSSAGVSFAIRSATEHKISVEISYGRYEKIDGKDGSEVWKRISVKIFVENISCEGRSVRIDLSEKCTSAAGAELFVRLVDGPDCRLATATLINGNMTAAARDLAESRIFFQTRLRIIGADGTDLIARPSARSFPDFCDDKEAVSNALLYRNVEEFAAGHTCSAEWPEPVDSKVEFVQSTWVPSGIVPDVSSAGHEVFKDLVSADGRNVLRADFLASAAPHTLVQAIEKFCAAYERWIEIQEAEADGMDTWEKKSCDGKHWALSKRFEKDDCCLRQARTGQNHARGIPAR